MVNIAEVFPGRIRILVVDDDSDLRLTLSTYLESRNFMVSSARNGAEAAAILQSGKQNLSATIDSRLERIESLLSRLVANSLS